VYGNWCGSGCTHEDYTVPSIDELDESCKMHDMCLRPYGPSSSPEPTQCERCACDQALRDASWAVSRGMVLSCSHKPSLDQDVYCMHGWKPQQHSFLTTHLLQVYMDNRNCNPNIFGCFLCIENEYSRKAYSVNFGMEQHMNDNGCADIDYSSCGGAPAPSDSSDNASSATTASTDSDAGSSEGPSGSPSYCPYERHSGDILGHDIRHEPVSSADECCNICSADGPCYGW
jgi:hypothetical protein